MCVGNVYACHPCFTPFVSSVKADPGSTREIVKECSKTPRLGRSGKRVGPGPIQLQLPPKAAARRGAQRATPTPHQQRKAGVERRPRKPGGRARIQVNCAETWDVSGAGAAAVPQVAGPPRHKAPNHRRASYELAQARLYLCPEIIPGPSADSGVPPQNE